HVLVPKDHVAVEVLAAGSLGPLVADEGRERAARGAVVRGAGRIADLLPRTRGGLVTRLPILSAESVPQRRIVGGPSGQEEEGEARPATEDHAGGRVVAGRAGCLAHVDLTEELGVVGDGGEVERTSELRGAERSSLAVVRLDADLLPASEAIRVGGAI